MKTTVRGVILQINEQEKNYLDNLMDRFCAAVSWSYKRLLDGKKTQDIRLTVQGKFNLNSRQANDAVYDAQATIKSQTELVKSNHSNARKKVELTKIRLIKARSKKKKTNLTRKLDKEQRRLAELQKYIENGTTPPVVFGGKKLFIERCKDNISKEQWQEARSNRYLSRGDKTKGGNLNTRLYTKNGNIYLDLAAEQTETGKVIRYNRITVPVYLAHKPSHRTGQINGRNYRQMVLNCLKTGNAYQVEIIREKGCYYIHVTIEEETPQAYISRNGAVRIDTNLDGLGITHADYLGQYRESLWLSQGEWVYARSNRRDNLLGEAAALVVEMAKQLNSTLAVEDLEFRNDKSITAKFNRMSHSFVWSKFLAKIELIYAEPVCNHSVSQKASAGFGIITQAIEVDLMPAQAYSKEQSASGRVTTLLDFKTLKPKPHTVYLPAVYEEAMRFIYSSLDDSRDIALSGKDLPDFKTTELNVQIFDFARVARIAVTEAGADFERAFDEHEKAALDKGMVIIQVWPRLSWPWIGQVVDALRKRGYFLGGILPRWFDEDGMLMQKVVGQPNWEGIQLYTARAKELLKLVKADWESK